ncbi:hypothetical protein [Kribbella sp. NPDC049584]|uniref:hypothetical protein n=1 Tax=Kribbella sp. NPDC049584 TaxID=3154833 RepID=UPI003431B9B8
MDSISPESSGISRRTVIQASVAAGLATGLSATAGTVAAYADSPGIQAGIDVTKTSDPIQKYVYGAFIEHIGTLVYDSLWSEVLSDRKFFYPVDTQNPSMKKWRPVGTATAITMDTTTPYVGEQSAKVALSRSESRGIGQTGLGLAAKGYVGRVVIAGDPGTHVVATLAWGDGPGQSQSVTLAVKKGWTTIPLRFTCRAATTAGTFQITGTGSGEFRVGAASLMPADNVKGFRKDTIDLLRGMGGFWRFPGGNFVSGHDWQNAIGDPDLRATTFDYDRNQAQSNDVGTDEFLAMCDLLDTEPYPCVNTGLGSAREAALMVEYVNGAADTPMGRRRAENGHPKPYNVKYWAVGNEMFGFWQLGYMTPAHYMIKHNLFADAMRKVDPDIAIVAVGAFPASMTVHRLSYYIDPSTRQIVQPTPVNVAYGSATDWNYRLLKSSSGKFDIISEHCYGTTQRFDLDQGKYVDVSPAESVVDSSRRGANYIKSVHENWDLFTKDFPELQANKIKVSIDEWGFQKASGLKQLFGLAMMLHEMFRASDFITMAAYTMGTSWLSYNKTDSTYSGAGVLFKLYRERFGVTPVAITGNSPQPTPGWPAGGDQPSVNAGSPTYPVDMMAALSEDGRTLTVATVNATADVQNVTVDLAGFQARPNGRLWRLTGTSLDATNRVGQPPQVTVAEATFDARDSVLATTPYSIEIRAFTRA